MSTIVGRRKKRLGDILVNANVITNEQLQDALKKQKELGKRLGDTLIDLGFLTDTDIAKALHQQLNIELVNVRDARIPKEVLSLFKEPIVRKLTIIPFDFDPTNANILRVAMADPLDIVAIDDLGIIANRQIVPLVAPKNDILFAIERYYGNEQAIKMAETYSKERAGQLNIAVKERQQQQQDITEDIDSAPIVQLVSKIIQQAVTRRASDIHIEALEDNVRIRYRIDGVLQEVMRYDKELLAAIVARVKIVSGMDISEKRIPQDGRMTTEFDHVEYDIRVSSLPTVYGEKVVMRLANKSALTRDKSELGLSSSDMKDFESILKNPHGIILVTGPTGSGKSTTLYTVLSELNQSDVNIVTVEDPVEANIEGINQVQVNERAGMTFAGALRSILRQDPDIIMIGEIRDEETAGIAVKAAITGHLVVSTLHTNSAASTISRLLDMGVEPYMIADATVGIIAQRLVRRLCPKCKVSHDMDATDKRILGLQGDSTPEIYGPSQEGCAHCNGTGYHGRIGIYEIMPITSAIREKISEQSTPDEIQAIAQRNGMSTLKLSGAKLVLQGVTSVAEVERITYE